MGYREDSVNLTSYTTIFEERKIPIANVEIVISHNNLQKVQKQKRLIQYL